MKLGSTTLLAAALAASLLVPAADAKPGHGHGNGHGPPVWAGGAGKADGKPASPGKSEVKKAENAQRRDERRTVRRAAENGDQSGPKHDNPAWVCTFEREQTGTEAFLEEHGSNGNKANAFGKCVSREAHERDGAAADHEETPEPGGERPVVSAGTRAVFLAFLQALRQLVL